ncbi:MAG: LPS export ABC transporter periplasmic protein LptC [Parvibaculum sp.]|uniref:LPS export ABC transporter periplasmic protein LptC n=1 Tax=Parvibaculum sp. TaxID=2024848 RepID=UPI0032678976
MSQRTGDEPEGSGAARRRPVPRTGIAPEPGTDRPLEGRYSRFVSLMKIVLPLGALVLFGVILVYSGVFRSKDKLDIAFREIDTSPSDLRMVSPRVTGVTEDGTPYVITADNATQDPARPNFVTFDNIQADMKFNAEEDWMSLTASGGTYNSEMQTLELVEKIDIFTTWGYEIHGEAATIDFDEGVLRSDSEIKGHGPLGTLRADRMKAEHASQVLRFDGNVKMLILPDQPGEGGEE